MSAKTFKAYITLSLDFLVEAEDTDGAWKNAKAMVEDKHVSYEDWLALFDEAIEGRVTDVMEEAGD